MDLDDVLPSPSDADTPLPPTSRWRRPLLLISGASFLGLGIYVNAERLGLDGSYEDRMVADASSSSGKREEKREDKPSSHSKPGQYAMKGPGSAPPPQLARNFDPEQAARSAGIQGVMQQSEGHFLGSPHGGAFAVGNDDSNVWGSLTGAELGHAYGVGGLGLVGTGRGGGGRGPGSDGLGYASESYAHIPPSQFIHTSDDLKSTFSIDVDTASYSNVRSYLLDRNRLPPADAVRTEELINYFDYDYAMPSGDTPFSLTTEVGPCPWNPSNRLVHVGVQAIVPAAEATPPRNLVFLIDVSGSMQGADRLGLVQHGLAALTDQLGEQDRVSIVVYAGAAGAVLPPTSGSDKPAIRAALARLEAGGSTNGAEGIELAYRLAEQHFVEGGINRVILATDGDFNVGISDHDALVKLIEQKRETGVFLSVLGVGRGNLDDHMMEQVADHGNGNYAYLDGESEARKVLVEEVGGTLHTVAKDVKIQVEFDADQVAQHRLIGYENRALAHHEFDDDTKDAGEIGAGHTVTAIYEIVPTGEVDDDPMMTLDLRYKQPEGKRSSRISTDVRDSGQQLDDASNDYRFSAAVAMFAEALRNTDEQARQSYAAILELAEGALGSDPHCYRHEFLELVWKAGTLAGEKIERPNTSCSVVEPSEPSVDPDPEPEPTITPAKHAPIEVVLDVDIEEQGESEQDWMTFALEVLRLLPPLLALPMFVMALRRPRPRRRG